MCKDKEGLLRKETIRGVYDGSLFQEMEREILAAAGKKKDWFIIFRLPCFYISISIRLHQSYEFVLMRSGRCKFNHSFEAVTVVSPSHSHAIIVSPSYCMETSWMEWSFYFEFLYDFTSYNVNGTIIQNWKEKRLTEI